MKTKIYQASMTWQWFKKRILFQTFQFPNENSKNCPSLEGKFDSNNWHFNSFKENRTLFKKPSTRLSIQLNTEETRNLVFGIKFDFEIDRFYVFLKVPRKTFNHKPTAIHQKKWQKHSIVKKWSVFTVVTVNQYWSFLVFVFVLYSYNEWIYASISTIFGANY